MTTTTRPIQLDGEMATIWDNLSARATDGKITLTAEEAQTNQVELLAILEGCEVSTPDPKGNVTVTLKYATEAEQQVTEAAAAPVAAASKPTEFTGERPEERRPDEREYRRG